VSKLDARKLSHTMCFSCAQIFPKKREDPIGCPSCGFAIHAETYHRIITYAICAVYYGHDYRRAYDKQMAEHGEITTRYALPDPATVLCFCGAAALSNIIGGIAYDLVKKAIRAVVNRARSIDQDIGQSRVFLNTAEEIDSFIQCVREYCADHGAIDRAVLLEIEREEIVCEITELIPKTSSPTKDEILEAVRKAIGNVKERKHPSGDDFNSFWEELPNH